MKIAAVVILYNPPKSTLFNIQTYYNYVERIFVFDNSEEKSLIKDDLLKLPKVVFSQNFENQGISKRLNKACKIAIQEHYDWLLTMDQDSNFSEDAISYYFNCFRQFKEKENVAMFGTNRSRELGLNNSNCTTIEIQQLITSGSLLNLKAFKNIGNFDELLFIDLVDNEYCERAKMSGYSIILFSNVHMEHELGKQVYASSIKSLFIIKKKKEVHSSLRCYYMYRNLLYIENKYKARDKVYTKKLRKDVIARIKTCIFYGGNAWKTLKYLFAGYKDFKNGQMGKIKKEL